MKLCSRPLDPIDVEALASGAEPVLDASAAEHAASCDACRAAVASARALDGYLSGAPDGDELAPDLPAADLASRILRLRTFSRAERSSLSLWKAPLLLFAAVSLAGILLLGSPALTVGEQAGFVASFASAAAAILRALAGWSADLVRSGPAGLEGLAQALRREPPLGWIALLALLPSALGLRRMLARERRPVR